MKRFINYLAILAIFSGIFFSSCQDETSESDWHETQDYFVKEGILHVDNEVVLESLISQASSMSNDELLKWQQELGFQSYYSFYEDIFTEYEQLFENISSESQILEFIDIHKGDVIFPGGTVDGEPNYTIEPKVNTGLDRLANQEGKLIVAGEYVPTNSSLKSSTHCYKRNGRRRMWVDFLINNQGDKYARVSHAKRMWVGWRSYRTNYYWRFSSTSPGYFSLKDDVPSGYSISFKGYNPGYVEIWSRGVGESHKCTYQYY
ncbi:MAG: hypothetical protein MI866_00745 [Bacteroidales bacterium]|nr:hypothetical protein [Bacteroidales bacterium]